MEGEDQVRLNIHNLLSKNCSELCLFASFKAICRR